MTDTTVKNCLDEEDHVRDICHSPLQDHFRKFFCLRNFIRYEIYNFLC